MYCRTVDLPPRATGVGERHCFPAEKFRGTPSLIRFSNQAYSASLRLAGPTLFLGNPVKRQQ